MVMVDHESGEGDRRHHEFVRGGVASGRRNERCFQPVHEPARIRRRAVGRDLCAWTRCHADAFRHIGVGECDGRLHQQTRRPRNDRTRKRSNKRRNNVQRRLATKHCNDRYKQHQRKRNGRNERHGKSRVVSPVTTHQLDSITHPTSLDPRIIRGSVARPSRPRSHRRTTATKKPSLNARALLSRTAIS
jgi:hypothetical protein